MPPRRQKTVRPRSGKKRVGLTVQIHPEKHQEMLDWLKQKGNNQETILDALYAKMNSERGIVELADTKPMIVPTLEPDPSMLRELYDALVAHMDEQFSEVKLQVRGLKQSMNTTLPANSTATTTDLKPELKVAMRAAMRPGKSK